MMAVTRRGLYSGARSPYGSFSGKVAEAGKPFVKRFTRLALYGVARVLYGDFSGKVAVVPVIFSGSGLDGPIGKRKNHDDEDLQIIMMMIAAIDDG